MPSRRSLIRRNRNRSSARNRANDDRTVRDGLSVGEVFETAIQDVVAIRDGTSFRGTVDIGVTFRSANISSNGLIGVIFGGDNEQSSVEVKLAARVHLDDLPDEPNTDTPS